MANKALFANRQIAAADTINEAGGRAYRNSSKQALAQYASTGCLNSTFYATASEQLDHVLAMCEECEPEFIARTALYARQKGYMKDMPALLCAVLSVKSPGLLAEIFDRVIDNGRMLRNFVQIMRSGAVGRKSLGSLPKRLILQWLENRSDQQLFAASVGNDPSLVDVIKMVHPKPTTESREALYGWLLGRDHKKEHLPEIVREYIRFKHDPKAKVPEVPFQLLTSMNLKPKHWKRIARQAPWQMTRMNLNTFQRQGVFEDRELVGLVANRLQDPKLIRRSRVFPYQLMVAHANVNEKIPCEITNALNDAMEHALQNVPKIDGRVIVCPDVSGSMHSAATGARPGATSVVRCIDVAALVAAAILRKNRNAEVIPFESKVVKVRLNPNDSVMTNAKVLSSLPAGGTDCSAPLKYLNHRKQSGDLIAYVSDNESWVDSPNYGWMGGSATETMNQWTKFKARNRQAKMVCIDVQPQGHTQAKEREDIINVGGFNDQVFKLLADVANGSSAKDHWVTTIEAVAI